MVRPTLYNDEILKKTAEYINGGWRELGQKIPSIAGLAVSLGISRETVHAWVRDGDKPQFSDIIENLLTHQEDVLLSNGLDGTYNPTITKLILGKHNYHDSQKTEHSGSVSIKNILEEIQNGS